ncbi:hypothetical protein OESDEN_09044 [Oesophagostomum dentatum]|uniref:Uncharacterized protein n=1 Tax=Oesophagostomum dentatum TaxID=61180 RepID=A0A0B1T4N7_OESDE|nr:hypothetical protein OESDEN_09044 [Oesophagostomum dentatum]
MVYCLVVLVRSNQSTSDSMSVQSKLFALSLDPQWRKRVIISACAGAVGLIALSKLSCASGRKKVSKENGTASLNTSRKKRKALDAAFLGQLLKLFRIMVPGVFSKEAGIIGMNENLCLKKWKDM